MSKESAQIAEAGGHPPLQVASISCPLTPLQLFPEALKDCFPQGWLLKGKVQVFVYGFCFVCFLVVFLWPHPRHMDILGGGLNPNCNFDRHQSCGNTAGSLFVFSGLHLQHMDVPRPGVELELWLPAYATATATLSCVCNLHQGSWQCRILNPPSEARGRTCILSEC